MATAAARKRSTRKTAAKINKQTADDQEIGPLKEPKDPERRKSCAADNLLFAETYFPNTFYLGWAPYQRSMMDAFQDVLQNGGKKARAVRRGGLKSTCARVSAVWAALNGIRKFLVLIGATDGKANEHRKNFFDLIKSSPTLLEDYPELEPLLIKYRQPKRQLRLNERLLEVTAKDDKGCILFPDILPTDAEWVPSSQTRVAPYSVKSTDVSGLSFVNDQGVTTRPDCLIFDDVQTPQSAQSHSMTTAREDIIDKTFGGLAGLGETMAQVMVCTVREMDDLSDRYLDRKKHPDWDGEKYPSLIELPTDMALWDKYADLLRTGNTPEEGKAAAQQFYLDNMEAMQEGAVVAWEKDMQEGEVDALQSLMTIRALQPEFFACEIQQEGRKPANVSGVRLDSARLVDRLSHVPRGVVPNEATYLTAYVDSGDNVLWWMVCAWQNDFTGWVVDYGTWPDQSRPMFYKSNLFTTIEDQLPGASWEEAFTYAHNMLDQDLFQPRFDQSDNVRELDLVLKDWSDGDHKPRLEAQIPTCEHRKLIRPSKGFAPKPGRKPVHQYGGKNDRSGNQWVERLFDGKGKREPLPHVQYNTNEWKSHAARRLLTTIGAPASVSLFGSESRSHRLLAEHLAAEIPKKLEYDGSAGVVWEQLVGRDNDWLDCFVGNCVAASMLGCALSGEKKPERKKSKPKRSVDYL